MLDQAWTWAGNVAPELGFRVDVERGCGCSLCDCGCAALVRFGLGLGMGMQSDHW